MSTHPTPEQRTPLVCSTWRRLLAKVDRDGIWLWCRFCKCEHHFTFAMLEQLSTEHPHREQMPPPTLPPA